MYCKMSYLQSSYPHNLKTKDDRQILKAPMLSALKSGFNQIIIIIIS